MTANDSALVTTTATIAGGAKAKLLFESWNHNAIVVVGKRNACQLLLASMHARFVPRTNLCVARLE